MYIISAEVGVYGLTGTSISVVALAVLEGSDGPAALIAMTYT